MAEGSMVEADKNFALEIIKRIHKELSTEDSAEKLKSVISIITQETGATDASIYVKADDMTFEHIVSNSGATLSAVRSGEGLVGKSGADNQVSFAKTKNSFEIAIPLKRWNKSIGVLLITHSKSHEYDEQEMESLEAVCMFLSEFIASEEI